MSLLEVSNLTITDRRRNAVIVKDVCFTLERNSCLGIVGESGSGKSMTSKAILGLIHPSLIVSGTAHFDGKDLIQMKRSEIKKNKRQAHLYDPARCYVCF